MRLDTVLVIFGFGMACGGLIVAMITNMFETD